MLSCATNPGGGNYSCFCNGLEHLRAEPAFSETLLPCTELQELRGTKLYSWH